MAGKTVEGIEVRDDQLDIETVAGSKDFAKVAADEAFMNESVTIEVHPSTREDEVGHIILNCNGINMPIMRGVRTTVKRKYVEILARMKETRYTQRTPNPSEPDRIQMVPRTAQVYPFSVLEDRNPKGRAWLAQISAERG